jgi:hypothetical protein
MGARSTGGEELDSLLGIGTAFMARFSPFIRLCSWAFLVCLLLPTVSQAQKLAIWNGQPGDWFDPTKWQGGVVPADPSWDVDLNGGGYASLSGSVRINNFDLHNARFDFLSADGKTGPTMEILGTFNQAYGVTGFGTTIVDGTYNPIGYGGTAGFAYGMKLITKGTTNLTIGRAVSLFSADGTSLPPFATWTNEAGAAVKITDGSIGPINQGTFVNKGSVQTANAGIYAYFDNSGSVQVGSLGAGTLGMSISGGRLGGAWSIAENSSVIVGYPFSYAYYQMMPGTTVEGKGTWRQTGDQVVGLDPQGTFTFNTPVEIAYGHFATKGVVNINNNFTWSGGTLGDGYNTDDFTKGVINLNGAHNLIESGAVGSNPTSRYAVCTINSTGTTDVQDSQPADIHGGHVTTWTNAGAGSLFVLHGSNANLLDYGTFVNQGTFRKTDGGTSTVSWDFKNSGVVESLSGTLHFEGSYTQTAGTTRIAGGTIAFDNAPLILGGTVQVLDGIYGGGQPVQLMGGVLKGNGVLNTTVEVSSGAIAPGNSPGILTIGGLTMTGGALQIELGGLTPGNGTGHYDQLVVTPGAVALGDGLAQLELSFFGGFVPSVGDSFVILDNQGPTATTGFFAGWKQGSIEQLDGHFAQIDYHYAADADGLGNDIRLTFVNGPSNAVPEPASALLLVAGATIGLLLLLGRRVHWGNLSSTVFVRKRSYFGICK